MKTYCMTHTPDDSWLRIVQRINVEGIAKKQHLIAALARGENVPIAAQTYLASVLAGKVDQRGKVRRHRTGAEVQLLDGALLARVGYWRQVFRARNERGPLERAYEEVKKEIGRSKMHVEREYKAAAKRRQTGWPAKLVATEKVLDDAYWRFWAGRRVSGALGGK